MNEITTLLTCLHPLLDSKIYRQLQIVSEALLMMTGRITMLSMSRWTGKGGSYRTLQRFFKQDIPWLNLNWAIAKKSLEKSDGVVLVAGDATTVTKSGKKTFGLGRFFSSIYSRAVPGIAFQILSLLEVNKRISWPILIEQILPKPKTKKEQNPKKKQNEAEVDPKVQKTRIAVMSN